MTELAFDVVAPGYEPVAELMRTMAGAHRDWTFELSIRDPDGLAVQASAGAGDDTSAIHLQASVTKGLAGLVIGSLVEAGAVDLEAPVASLWPEFGVEGKEWITVAEALSHQAGLLGFGSRLGLDALEDGRAADDLASQRPRWAPGTAHGYHSFTIGVIVDELCRRVTGDRVWKRFEALKDERSPADVWIRLPADRYHRLVDIEIEHVRPAENTGTLADDAHAMLNFLGPGGAWLNNRDLIAAGSPAVSAVGSAAGIADIYASALGMLGGRPLLSRATLAAMGQLRAAGEDLVLGGETRYGVLFQKPRESLDFGTSDAIGHDGAGGALGFADPRTGVAFGYTTRHARQPGGADRRALAIAREVRRIRLRSGA